MGLSLDVAIPGRLFRFRRTIDDLAGKLRRSRLLLSRGDDFRLPPFRFECLAKVVRLRILLRRAITASGRPVSCRSWWQTKASEARGALSRGQEFLSANSLARLC